MMLSIAIFCTIVAGGIYAFDWYAERNGVWVSERADYAIGILNAGAIFFGLVAWVSFAVVEYLT